MSFLLRLVNQANGDGIDVFIDGPDAIGRVDNETVMNGHLVFFEDGKVLVWLYRGVHPLLNFNRGDRPSVYVKKVDLFLADIAVVIVAVRIVYARRLEVFDNLAYDKGFEEGACHRKGIYVDDACAPRERFYDSLLQFKLLDPVKTYIN